MVGVWGCGGCSRRRGAPGRRAGSPSRSKPACPARCRSTPRSATPRSRPPSRRQSRASAGGCRRPKWEARTCVDVLVRWRAWLGLAKPARVPQLVEPADAVGWHGGGM
eukprot:780241-Prymnesium_polylepis.1